MAAIPSITSTQALSGIKVSTNKREHADEEMTSSTRQRLESAGAAPAKPTPDRLVQLLKDTVAQCTYGKDFEKVLAPWHQFEVSTNPDGDQLLLKNYEEPPSTKPPFKGVCNELAYMVGNYVQKLISRDYRQYRDYIVFEAEGECNDYFARGNHVYLLLWPKQDNEKMKVHLKESPGSIPNDCFLVDPSFHRVLLPGENIPERGRYRLKKIGPLSHMAPPSLSMYAFPEIRQLPCGFPVGYVNDVIAENQCARWSRSPEALLLWGAEPVEGMPPRVSFRVAPSPEARVLSEENEMVRALPDDHVLKRFWTKVTSDLTASWNRHLASSLRDSLKDQVG